MVFLFVIDLCQQEDDLQALKVAMTSYNAEDILVIFAGVITDVTQFDSTQCSSRADNIWEDGIKIL